MAKYIFQHTELRMPAGAICFLSEVKRALNDQQVKWSQKTNREGQLIFTIDKSPAGLATAIDTTMDIVYGVQNYANEKLRMKALHNTVHLLDDVFSH